MIGAIVTSGNPEGDVDNSLVGVDFRYLNTRLGEDRVIEATAWYQQTDTEGLNGDDTAYGVSVAMPNSRGWNGEVSYKRLEENYFPALGFASRTDVVDADCRGSGTAGARRTAGSARSRAAWRARSSTRSRAATGPGKSI